MSIETFRVFISSTWLDLGPERAALEGGLHAMRAMKVVGMEYFGSRPEDTRTVSLSEVDQCHLYVGIVGGRYGSGITEDEYQRARQRALPCLIYLKDDLSIPEDQRDADDSRRARLAAFKAELRASHTSIVFSTPQELTARVVGDVHNWLFDKYLLQGSNALPGDFGVRIGNFLAEYLGTAEQPVPFGGRDADLDRLDGWLDGAQQPPYLLLAGPAGRGKSALLVRWSRRIAQRGDVAVVFVPVSVRFRTNLASVVFSVVTARLAMLHGEPIPGDADTPAEVWRGLMSSYLARPPPDGRQVVLIVDGLDEAADWEAGPDLFSSAPGGKTRVLLSARYLAGDLDSSAWIARLGWERPGTARGLDLAPLSPQGLAEVLATIGDDVLGEGARADLVSELHRLTEGDPLLVRLYVSDLAREPKTRLAALESLSRLRPGLDGYFSRWWDEQRRLWGQQTPLREPAVQSLLNLLACALGPLLQRDLLALLSGLAEVSVWTLEEALRPLGRFIVGDGFQLGYAFSHPRLAGYFYERLQRAGQARQIESAFLRWGGATLCALNDGSQDPAEAPTYVVQHYRTHLERSGARTDDVLALVSGGWLQAWNRIDRGSYAGFLSDAERARHLAETADAQALEGQGLAPHLGAELLCALCQSSVNSLVSLPFGLLVALSVKRGLEHRPVARLQQPHPGLAVAVADAGGARRAGSVVPGALVACVGVEGRAQLDCRGRGCPDRARESDDDTSAGLGQLRGRVQAVRRLRRARLASPRGIATAGDRPRRRSHRLGDEER